ncbi:MAG: hypothetical protein R6U39_02105 [Candidatus Aegiribacteria sp.]
MRNSAIPVFVLFILIIPVPGADGSVSHNLGISGGFPQMVAITYKADLARYFALEGYAGSLGFTNATAGGRLIVGSTLQGIKPRFFAGVCVVDQYYASYPGNPTGRESYAWGGGGVAYEFPDGFELAADLAYVAKGDRDRGLGYNTGLSFSAGLMFPL